MVNADDLAQIVAGCKKAQEEAFAKLVDIYAKRCFGYFYRLTGNVETSNDLLSELFVRLVEKIGSYKEGSFEKWLFRISSNIFYDYLREKQRREKAMQHLQQHRIETTTVENNNETSLQIDSLQRQLEKLDAETRELVLLRFYSELSFKEIAKMRSMPIGTVLSKVHRGLKSLRELMGSE